MTPRAFKAGLIVSCQPEAGGPFDRPAAVAAFALAAEKGGARAVRVCGVANVAAVRAAVALPIIGLTKSAYPSGGVLITPTLEDAVALAKAGADLIAVDATARRRPDLIAQAKKKAARPIVADVSTYDEGVAAARAGADFLATTLSGYIDGEPPEEPDFKLVKRLAAAKLAPVIAEGRVWTAEQALKLRELGAYAVCVGTAITRPGLITRRFALACA